MVEGEITFRSVGLTAAYATSITTSFSAGSGVGARPTCIGVFSVSIHAAWFSVMGDIVQKILQ